MEPRASSVRYILNTAFHSLAYLEWGDPAAPPVLCVHGLTRNAHDFDPLARALAGRYRLICPDLPGRGASDWLPAGELYQPLSYVQALSHLLAVIGQPVHWVGTSLGGICGMAIAAAQGHSIKKLVLNDIGPVIALPGLERIHSYVAGADLAMRFGDLAEVEEHLRRIHAPFGPITDAQWTDMARHSAMPAAEGGHRLHYDPKLADPIRAAKPAETPLWHLWSAIRVPVMVVRGGDSDLLDPATFAHMAGDGARSLELADIGHAPSLMDPPTIAAIADFLADDAAPALAPTLPKPAAPPPANA
ncbi:MAG: alpha/beta hydrolase [Acetobacteraceae bacterium]|nr:alpha/beta hydrolase [Acetobacteraceae bacterium]